jgi:hypothetical protein
MKKIYAILVAAAMSVSLFAAPSQADLQSLMQEGHYLVAFSTPQDATCQDIVWVGNYAKNDAGDGWSTNLADLVKCEKLDGFANWYYAVIPVVDGETSEGKPVQLNECGQFDWTYQCGGPDYLTKLAGGFTIENGFSGEANLKNWSADEPNIFEMTAWKLESNPCKDCAQMDITIRVYSPGCEWNDELRPTIMGSFNNWAAPLVLTRSASGTYYEGVMESVTASVKFKFNNDANGSWDNEFLWYDEENDAWNNFGDFDLDPASEQARFYTRVGNTLTFNFEDEELFMFASCHEPVEPDYLTAEVTLQAPAGAPAAGVEIVGGFGTDTWNNGILMQKETDGSYTATVENININDANAVSFKFRQLGSWDNQIQVFDGEAWKDMDNLSFNDFYQEGDEKINVELDFSDAASYKWTTPEEEQGIENIILTEKARKVVVDGVLYIVRDNKLFNVQGVQVR